MFARPTPRCLTERPTGAELDNNHICVRLTCPTIGGPAEGAARWHWAIESRRLAAS